MFFPFRDENPAERTPVVTYALIAINVLCFLWLSRLPESVQERVTIQHGFIPARIGQLLTDKPIEINAPALAQYPHLPFQVVVNRTYRLPPTPGPILLSLLTTMFLHGGWLHLLGNMWFLFIFGNNVEDRLGHVPFLLFYLVGGLLASGFHWLINPGSLVPVVGASGAISAVLGAYAITWPFARIQTLVFLFIFVTVLELPALVVLGGWFLIQILEASQAVQVGMNGGVAWWAHIGGFAAGAVLMSLFGAEDSGRHTTGTEESRGDGVSNSV